MVASGRRVVITAIYGEDAWWLKDGEPLGGSEPDPPITINLAETVILTSGFALRDDDEWKRSMQLDLTEYHRCTVACLPRDPIAEFLHRLRCTEKLTAHRPVL